MTRYELPISDPTPDLSPTAARILEAAKRVLAGEGFRALTFERIAAEAGENPALIRYHFGSKAGLVSMLIDSVMYLESVELIEQLTGVPAGAERRKALFSLHERYARDTTAYQMFYEIIPHIMRDEDLRPHLRDLFDWYRKLDAWALGAQVGVEPPAQLEQLALLAVALADGVALQVQADPGLDIGPALDLWRTLVFGYLSAGGAPPAGGA